MLQVRSTFCPKTQNEGHKPIMDHLRTFKALVNTVLTGYDTSMVMKIFTIGLPAECDITLMSVNIS